MRDVAVVAFAQSPPAFHDDARNEVEILMPVLDEAFAASGIDRKDIGFTVSGSSDYLAGQAFSFVTALDAVGPWPPISESHVEMDGAWAMYEAWVKLQMGDVDTALVYAFGKSSPGDLRRVLALQLDPYCMQPLWPDPVSLAALQARAFMEATGAGEKELAEVAARTTGRSVDQLLDDPYVVSPLRTHDCPPVNDGASVMLLAAGDLARDVCERPAYITGIDHRIEAHALGLRDLTTSVSTRLAGEKAGVGEGPVDVAELHAPFTHQELILREALDLPVGTDVNPSGGALANNPVMVAGLDRIGHAARRIMDGTATRAVAHATSGPCLQQNLVCVLSGEANQ
jgi:acetyl-CoA acetyltransferase